MMEWFEEKKISEKSLFKIEEIWGIKLPKSFFELIKKVNGGYSDFNIYDTERNKQRCFSGFLNFDLDNEENVIKIYSWISDRLPEKVFPFSEDPGGNYICFDFRGTNQNPKIVLWNHEYYIKDGKEYYEIELVADSFDEFLNKLYKYEDDEDIDFSQFEVLS